MRLSEVAGKVGLTFSGHDIDVSGVNTLAKAGQGDIAPLLHRKYLPQLAETQAGAVLCEEKFAPEGKSCLITQNPKLDWARVVALFAKPQGCLSGISSQAFVHPEATIGEGVTLYPFVFVGARATVGAGSTLFPGVYVGEDCAVGENATLYPNVALMAGTVLGENAIVHAGAVLGSDGYGYAQSPQGHVKVPQVGNVVIGRDVEIGANAAIDRAALESTKVGDGTKIDNLVQIAHNVETGKHCLIISQVGIAGSTKLGNGVVLAGQAGLRDNITLGDGVQVAAQSGVGQDLAPGTIVGGSPSMDAGTYLKVSLTLPKLPELMRRVKRLEKAAEGQDKETGHE
ncbi:MAG TPA: UDP-3-O-(3-hydroxymyristoyl)glucosamine N-acyltransferase [Humidesulfovibrio sp.]|uniref:UDP-3-O-(3-hydroxymyristoyl)glucosamine N-acyltransferase n=1 Tax=Humidesulfovibrio sp. TaxID=2910988 RepID=UPI002BF26B10|nr:UDP-3-O-(3-hydroxymyristoyl)glucosamine N-acyltransferase [Humidesulfovibrio sp.]HWR03758.1 UDP-3-O-(3-hydroxymyristoyl)glucosamine N-acyltransferase [Humidesulfovibrio sp.]